MVTHGLSHPGSGSPPATPSTPTNLQLGTDPDVPETLEITWDYTGPSVDDYTVTITGDPSGGPQGVGPNLGLVDSPYTVVGQLLEIHNLYAGDNGNDTVYSVNVVANNAEGSSSPTATEDSTVPRFNMTITDASPSSASEGATVTLTGTQFALAADPDSSQGPGTLDLFISVDQQQGYAVFTVTGADTGTFVVPFDLGVGSAILHLESGAGAQGEYAYRNTGDVSDVFTVE